MKTPNPHLVELTIAFELEGSHGGEYLPEDRAEVKVRTDGETVAFILPDGRRWVCEREPIQAVVR